jgi:hypothetical protein
MASERRHGNADPDRIPAGLPEPLPPGWVFHPRRSNASIEELRKHVGVGHFNGLVTLEEIMYDDDDDAGVSDEEWQRWQREGLDASQ